MKWPEISRTGKCAKCSMIWDYTQKCKPGTNPEEIPYRRLCPTCYSEFKKVAADELNGKLNTLYLTEAFPYADRFTLRRYPEWGEFGYFNCSEALY